jgi:pimeloyl-ACP methyl ester carboxylesterase
MAETTFRPLPVEPDFLPWRGHRFAHYRAGAGSPVLLVHSINAAASAFEMRRPFAALSADHAVHAIDLLGYGCSDRPARRYSAEDYADQILVALAAVGAPAHVVASSLGAAYAIAAAAARPELFRSLTLVCPTGMDQLRDPAGPGGWAAYRVLRGPAGKAIYEGLTSRAGVKLFLGQQAYHDQRSLTPDVLDGFYRACRAPGALYAPICFLTGLLNCDVRASFPRLAMPLLLVWGAQATTTPLRQADAFLAANPRARLEVIDRANLLVQDERPEAFNTAVSRFIAAA